MIGPVNRRENWKLGRDVVKTLIISDNQAFHDLIISPLIIRLFPYLDYHESVILQKTRLQGLILIIKSTYQGWYHSLDLPDPDCLTRLSYSWCWTNTTHSDIFFVDQTQHSDSVRRPISLLLFALFWFPPTFLFFPYFGSSVLSSLIYTPIP